MKKRSPLNCLMPLSLGLCLFFPPVAEPLSDTLEKMVLVPAGHFQMGSQQHGNDEKPVHTVHVSAFYIDKYEVTQKEFEQVMGENPSRFKGADLPVDRATWFAAKAYCEKLNKRLPTEAEWEYAVKAGDDAGGFWFKGNSKKHTHPGGQKNPNALGIYDMLGNLWEWVEDWYAEDYYKVSPLENPKGHRMENTRCCVAGRGNFRPASFAQPTACAAHPVI